MTTFFLRFWFVIQTKLLREYTLLLLPLLMTTTVQGQTTIRGRVVNASSNAPIQYASVYLQHSTDAATADSAGVFVLTTSLQGPQVLVVTAIGFQELDYPLVI